MREARAVREAGPYRWEKAGWEVRGGVLTPPYGRGKIVREEGRADMESAPTDGGGLAVSLPQSLRDSPLVRGGLGGWAEERLGERRRAATQGGPYGGWGGRKKASRIKHIIFG